jgi:hypothetical protein
MEACSTGFLDIAKLLVHFGASVVLTDRYDWTAVDHLRQFIATHDDIGMEKTDKLTNFLQLMEAKQMKGQFLYAIIWDLFNSHVRFSWLYSSQSRASDKKSHVVERELRGAEQEEATRQPEKFGGS